MITEQDILKALSRIVDPDFNRDIVSLGFVRRIRIEGGAVQFDIALTTPACPVKAQFEQQAREAVAALDGVTSVTVNMTSQPQNPDSRASVSSPGLAGVRSIIAVSSCKGGVGKSTIAAHLAMELAGRGHKVGLVDADIHGPSLPALFNLRQTPVYVNAQKQLLPVEKNELKLMSFGFLLGDAPAVMRGPIVSRYVQQVLHQTDWGELDYLFVDMPPGTGDVQLTITQSVRLSGAVIVTTRQTLSLVDVSRGILMFEKVDVPILGIVENMSFFVCDQCDKRHDIFGGGKSGALEERFGLATLGEIPVLPQLALPLEGPAGNSYVMETVDRMVRSLGKQSIQKKQVPEISFDAAATRFRWADGEEAVVANRDLRLSCRCAVCVNELTGEQILDPASVRPDIAPENITPLGNYAVGIEWNDGHTSGIYPYRTIRQLASSVKA